MSSLTLYHFPPSPHSRGALFAIRNLGLDVNIKIVDLLKKEQLDADFVKINPQHCIPTLKDNDFVMWESRPIAIYLAQSKCPQSPLYPSDLKQRTIVNQRLYFDAGTLYPSIRAICYPVLFMGETKIAPEKREKLNESLGFLEAMLNGNKFVAGNTLTLADLFIFASLSSIVCVGADISGFKNISKWYKEFESLPGYEEHKIGAEMFGNKVKSLLKESL